MFVKRPERKGGIPSGFLTQVLTVFVENYNFEITIEVILDSVQVKYDEDAPNPPKRISCM